MILGPSGSGKSTLLNLLGGLDKPTSGEIIIDNENITNFSDKELTRYRAKEIGFIFQFYNLIPNLTACENIEIMNDVVDKNIDGKVANLWDKVVDFKLIYCKEWDMWFEIKVELDESNESIKTVFCTQLGQAELSQINLYDIEINTEEVVEVQKLLREIPNTGKIM